MDFVSSMLGASASSASVPRDLPEVARVAVEAPIKAEMLGGASVVWKFPIFAHAAGGGAGGAGPAFLDRSTSLDLIRRDPLLLGFLYDQPEEWAARRAQAERDGGLAPATVQVGASWLQVTEALGMGADAFADDADRDAKRRAEDLQAWVEALNMHEWCRRESATARRHLREHVASRDEREIQLRRAASRASESSDYGAQLASWAEQSHADAMLSTDADVAAATLAEDRLRARLVAAAALQVTSATVTSASPKVLAVEGGTEVVVTGTGFAGDAAVCRVDPAPGGSTHLINATTPNFNASVSLDGGETWVGAGVEIAYAEQVSVALDRRPYVGEASGHLLVRSSIPGVDALNVTAELPCVGASWRWDDVKANADVVLDLDFSALSLEPIHNDMIITVRYGDAVVTKRRRFHRVPVPPTAGGYVQVDHARAGLLVDGDPWIGQGWYVAATSNVSWNNSLERLADVIVYENAPKGINQGMPYGLSAHPPKAQLAFLDAVHRVGFKVIYPVVSGNVSINHGGPFDDSDKLEALRASVELVREHPALLGYYVCDDCCSNNHDVSLQAQVYAVMKDVDPYHPTIGASDCGNTWMFTDQAPSWLKSEQDDGDRVLPVATQPALQLSLDVVMQENYGGTLAAHAGTGAWAGGVGGDGWFRNGAAFEPVYNCPGAFAWKGTADAHLASMWLGAIDAGMYSDLNFIYTEAEYGGPVYPGESTASDAWQLAEQQAIFAEHVAYLRPALAAPSARAPGVRVSSGDPRAAWAVPDRGALNCSTILAVVNTNETRAHGPRLRRRAAAPRLGHCGVRRRRPTATRSPSGTRSPRAPGTSTASRTTRRAPRRASRKESAEEKKSGGEDPQRGPDGASLRGDVDVDAYLARHDQFHDLPLNSDDHAADMKLLADPREALRDQLAVRQLCVITLATPDLSAGPNSIAGRFAKSPMSRGAGALSYRLLEALAFQPLFTGDSLGRCGPAIAACPAWSADGSLKQLRRYTLARLYGVDARFRANSDYVAFSLHRLRASEMQQQNPAISLAPDGILYSGWASLPAAERDRYRAALAVRRSRQQEAQAAAASVPPGNAAESTAASLAAAPVTSQATDEETPAAVELPLVYDFRPGDLVISCISFQHVKKGDVGTVSTRVFKDADGCCRVEVSYDRKKIKCMPGEHCHRLDVVPDSGFVVGDEVLLTKQVGAAACGARGTIMRRGFDPDDPSKVPVAVGAIGGEVQCSVISELVHAPLLEQSLIAKGESVVSNLNFSEIKAGMRGVVVGPGTNFHHLDHSRRVCVEFDIDDGDACPRYSFSYYDLSYPPYVRSLAKGDKVTSRARSTRGRVGVIVGLAFDPEKCDDGWLRVDFPGSARDCDSNKLEHAPLVTHSRCKKYDRVKAKVNSQGSVIPIFVGDLGTVIGAGGTNVEDCDKPDLRVAVVFDKAPGAVSRWQPEHHFDIVGSVEADYRVPATTPRAT
ncbi:hypothetical protein JL721_3327 [Aureococcus anophagefferens]|nr:hypothetical protein JL721_3327 [Aureococcus anophagefferens]